MMDLYSIMSLLLIANFTKLLKLMGVLSHVVIPSLPAPPAQLSLQELETPRAPNVSSGFILPAPPRLPSDANSNAMVAKP
jgi:hypothetical protein